MEELLQIYEQLKVEIFAIDKKYSLTYVEPEIDLPDSLNLQKLTYKPKSEAELRELAEIYATTAMLSKQRSVENSYATKLKNLGRKRTEVARQQTVKLKSIDKDYTEALLKLERKLTNNGLLFSTTANSSRSAAMADYNERKEECNLSYEEEFKALDVEESDIDELYERQCELLNEEKLAQITKRYQFLVDTEEKLKTSIEKYNNSLEEREQRYQYNRAKYIDTARRNERDRVLDMTKLYLQLGDFAFRNRMIKEKYAKAQDSFRSLKRAEATALLKVDSFLYVHLESYYSTFVDWINTTLPV